MKKREILIKKKKKNRSERRAPVIRVDIRVSLLSKNSFDGGHVLI